MADELNDEQIRDIIANGAPDQGVIVIGSRSKVKVMPEVVLLTSAYSVGWRDAVEVIRNRLMSADHLTEEARAEAIGVIDDDDR